MTDEKRKARIRCRVTKEGTRCRVKSTAEARAGEVMQEMSC